MRAFTYFTCCAIAASTLYVAPVAEACGGFFCSRAPVDQNAERVVFHVRQDGSTEMVVQITYQGADDDFAWLLPVAVVPQNRDVFPQAALNALDVNTAPVFELDPQCQTYAFPEFSAGASSGADGGVSLNMGRSSVTVYVNEEVGPYKVVVIGSDDPAAAADWLRNNGYNIAETMDPYIKLYTADQMKFLALRLKGGATVKDIQPFKMTLPGETPGIPLRLTTLAAEPEMGVKTWIFADQRFGPANAEEVEIDNANLRWQPNTYPVVTNWDALVAREVDKYAGAAWVAEMAGSVEGLHAQIESSPVSTTEQQQAQTALLDLMGDSTYLTRLYTRLSPEEMTYDPLFRRSDAKDVAQQRQLPYVQELCDTTSQPLPSKPCDFAACGALGLCRDVVAPDTNIPVEACACAPGATARTTFAPDGSTTVSCQDQRLSFMNPGERTLKGDVFPDACAGFDCGAHGSCVAMNLTPTCECDEGYVARGWLDGQLNRRTECVESPLQIPADFYNRRPLERPEDLPVGRKVSLPKPSGAPDIMMDGSGDVVVSDPPSASGGACSASARGRSGAAAAVWALLALALYRRRRVRRAA